jgi:nicotinate-nucleotide adenylyltransferase
MSASPQHNLEWLDTIPPYGSGQRIGLLGGSFNPAHAGHDLLSRMMIKRLELDWLWWLVTPGNPLKETSNLPSLSSRMAQCQNIANHPRIRVTGIEAKLGTRYTADTLEKLKKRCPDARFIWLMGGDNLVQFHLWEDWQEIAASTPMAIYDRPSYRGRALHSLAANRLKAYRIDEQDARLLGREPMGNHASWCYLTGPLSALSSTLIRAQTA